MLKEFKKKCRNSPKGVGEQKTPPFREDVSGRMFFQGGVLMVYFDPNAAVQNYSGLGRFVNNQLANNKQNNSKNLANITQQADKNFNVNLSAEGLAALQNEGLTANVDTGIFTSKELSPKAQAFLDKLRENYGDYDFIVADNVDDPQALAAGSDKKYSVVLTSDELEKMANDEEYANSMMYKVEDAVKTADSVIEKAGLEGVQISQLTISFDNDGNTKLFATLEKLSESQQERLNAAKERAENADEEVEEIQPARVTIEAEDEESFLEQLLKIDWESIYNA